MRKYVIFPLLLIAVLASGPLLAIATGRASIEGNWRDANRDPVGLAPEPAMHAEAVVQVYAARAFSWRGAFGVHTWIAVKPREAARFEVLEVLGWRGRRGGDVLSVSGRPPDARWYGAAPELLLDLRGDTAARLIEPIRDAARRYPYRDRYELWPGPNSNTFVAFVAREVDGLNIELPVTAIGKDYSERLVDAATSGTGYMLGFRGVAGVTVALDEGIEFNLLGLSFGIDVNEPALKLPGIGRIGAASL